jgi:hypothetical protein
MENADRENADRRVGLTDGLEERQMFSPHRMAIAVDKSGNAKIGPMATTYAAKSSCPDACPFKCTKACYGMVGPAASVWKRIENGTHAEVAKDEADVVRQLSGQTVLRLHTVGDCSTDQAAKILAKACEEYSAKHGKGVYTYTHAWRTVNRKSWGSINVLASCENTAEAIQAMARGYAAAITVQSHDSATATKVDGVRLIPCPKQTHKTENCLKCGLCLRADKLLASRAAVTFAAHGPTTRAKKVLAGKNVV